MKKSKTTPDGIYRFQWMRNKQGGQKFGNQEEVRPLTREIFEEHVSPSVRQEFRDFDKYREAFPAVTHVSFFRQGKSGEFKLSGVGPLGMFLHHGERARWAKQVNDFASLEGETWGKTADSEAKTQHSAIRKIKETI